MKGKKYLDSILGRTIEQMKIAYLSNHHIIFLVTTEPDFVKKMIEMESILPVKKNGKKSNLKFLDKDYNLTGPLEKWTLPCIIVYQSRYSDAARRNEIPNSLLTDYVNIFSGYSGVNQILSDEARRGLVCLKESLILIVTDSEITPPAYIEPYSEVIVVPFVSKKEFMEIVLEEIHKMDEVTLLYRPSDEELDPDSKFLERLYHCMRGMTTTQIVNTLRKNKHIFGHIYCTSTEDEDNLIKSIRDDSQRIIKQSAALSLVESSDDKPEGMDKLDDWLQRHHEEISNPHNNWRKVIKSPKGILITGVPGTGKSMMAQYIARKLKLSLIKLDLGDVMGGFVGDSEKNMNQALRVIEALSPCVLWVDEMEKAFAGSSGSNGHETTKRVFGKFLTWMQEKEKRGVSCFVFATANDISSLPPELFRSGRFDEKFYIFMPSANECAKIFESHIKRQCKIFREQNTPNDTSLPLFNEDIINWKWFKEEILEKECIIESIGSDNNKVTNKNSFFIGSDIEKLIAEAKILCQTKDEKSDAIFDSDNFLKALKEALKKMRTYGETNIKDIVYCFSQLARNNFIPASSNIIIPLQGYNEFRVLQQLDENKPSNEPLYKFEPVPSEWPEKYFFRKIIKNEETWLEEMDNEYDKQLYYLVRNAINSMKHELINASYGNRNTRR